MIQQGISRVYPIRISSIQIASQFQNSHINGWLALSVTGGQAISTSSPPLTQFIQVNEKKDISFKTSKFK
jgi:hypothetical protein